MKKINSIHYGEKVLITALFFSCVCPSVLWIFSNIWVWEGWSKLIIVSIAIGCIILVLFFVHLTVELRQDKKINNYYEENSNVKLPIGKGCFECAACGNRSVYQNDTNCSICGICFVGVENKRPQDVLEIRKLSGRKNYVTYDSRTDL